MGDFLFSNNFNVLKSLVWRNCLDQLRCCGEAHFQRASDQLGRSPPPRMSRNRVTSISLWSSASQSSAGMLRCHLSISSKIRPASLYEIFRSPVYMMSIAMALTAENLAHSLPSPNLNTASIPQFGQITRVVFIVSPTYSDTLFLTSCRMATSYKSMEKYTKTTLLSTISTHNCQIPQKA